MKKKFSLSSNAQLLIIVLPSIFLIFVMKYLAYPGMLLAFKDYRNVPGQGFFYSLFTSEWVGMDNFRFLWLNPDILTVLRNTVGYSIINLILGTVLSVIAAVILHEIFFKKIRNTFQTMMFFPYFMSWVSVSFMMQGLLNFDNGIFNKIIEFFGGQPIEWYQEPKWWPFILVFMAMWKTIGYTSVIYLSAITSIDKSQYEAALIDGASKWNQFKYITLPELKPMIIILTILGIGGIMNSDFGLFYQLPLNSGALYSVTQTLDVFVYNALQQPSSLGLSASASLFQSVVGCILVVISNKIVSKIDKDNGLY